MGRSGKLYVLASLTELLHPDAVEQALLKRQAYRASLDAVPCYQPVSYTHLTLPTIYSV